MNLTIQQSDLLRAVSFALEAADKKSAMPILGYILLSAEDGKLTATATDMYIRCTSTADCEPESGGSACFMARDLFERVKAMPAGAVSITVTDNKATIKASGGARRFQQHTIPAQDFPSVSGEETALGDIPAGVLRSLIGLTHFSVFTDETRAHVNSLLLELSPSSLLAVSTDGHRLSKASAAVDGLPSATMLVPLKAVVVLRKLLDDFLKKEGSLDTIGVGRRGSDATFAIGDTVLAVRLVDATFPPYQQVIPKASQHTATCSREAFAEALDAVRVAASDKTGGVKVTLAPGLIKVTAESPESGSASDEVPSDCECGSALFGCNAKYLLDVLKELGTAEVRVECSGELDPVVIRPVGDGAPDALFVTMPLRL